MSGPARRRRVCRADELSEGAVLSRQLGGQAVAVARLEGRVVAFGALCPHQHADLAGGLVEEGGISCPDHLWHFDLSTGRCTSIPGARVPLYPAREERGWIVVELPA